MENVGEQIVIKGIGSYVPERVLTNEDLSKMVDTSDEWIVTRTGIKERRIARKNESTSDLCTQAALAALKDAKMDKNDIDLIILGTLTPDMLMPATATIVQKNLEIPNVPCFDFNAACTGFQYGLEIARSMMANQAYKNVLLISGDKLSSIVNWEDRGTCVLFGDGAGAMVLSREKSDKCGIVDVKIYAEGKHGEVVSTPAGGSREPQTEETIRERKHCLRMNGRELFKLAVQSMSEALTDILKKNELTIEDIAYVVTHQANIRIIDAVAEKLNMPPAKMHITVDRFGNTSASSIFLNMDILKKSGSLSKGDLVLTAGFGGGLTWGAAIIRF